VNISDIKNKLTSKDVAVLEQSLDYVNQRLSLERSRGERAEARASSLFTVAGILSGFVVVFLESFREGKIGQDVLTLIIFGSSILLLAKTLLYSVIALWALKGNELNADLPFELQTLAVAESLREELAWKIWEYYELLIISNQRLFYVNRAQRNLICAFLSFLCLAVSSFLIFYMHLTINNCVLIFSATFIVAGIVFLDLIAEKLGKLWTFK
jgi:hypothetical protein